MSFIIGIQQYIIARYVSMNYWWGAIMMHIVESISNPINNIDPPPREGNTSCGPCLAEAPPLFPSPHGSGSNTVTLEIRTSNCKLHWKDCLMEHDSRSFRHQVYASNLYKGPSPG